jgi:small-conductance mechanosensitive channel
MVMFAATLLLILLQAQPSQPVALLTPQDTLAYLNQTIDWYRQLAVEERIATETADVRFLNDDRQTAKQILQLAFDFARAEAKLLAAAKAVPAATGDTSDTQAQALAQATAKADSEVRDSKTELEGLKQKLQTAQGKDRRELQSTIDELQSEINLDQTRAETFHSILQFVGEGSSGGSLTAQIDELQRSIPELDADASKTPGVQTNAPISAPTVVLANRSQPSGILNLVTSLFALRRKVGTLDQSIELTDALGTTSGKFRLPLVEKLRVAAQRGEELAKAADTSNAAQLDQEKRDLDALTANFKQISTVVVPLGRQTILFDLHKRNLTRWRDTAQGEYSDELRSLIVNVSALGLALAVVFVLAEIWRKATFRYVKDIRRRHQFLLLRRIVMWCAVGITIAFGLATEIGSLATFAGLITAGLAVALQSVILAMAGYFFLVGKYGVRIGDRVQISGVTGNVVDIGLFRLHLMELGGPGTDPQPTGRVVVFSNSIVFQPAASFFKQIPGTNFGWHEVKLILAPDSDYVLAEKRMLAAVESVYAKYREKIVQQQRQIEKTYSLGVDSPEPRSRLHLGQTGLEVAIRYPLELEHSAEIDDQITRALLDALEKPPKLKLVGSGTPNIQPVIDAPPVGG